MMTNENIEVSKKLVENYLFSLVDKLYKILPLKESGEPTLTKYICSLQREMLGCRELVCALNDDGRYLEVLAILQFLREYNEEVSVDIVKADVFHAINITKKLRKQYSGGA